MSIYKVILLTICRYKYILYLINSFCFQQKEMQIRKQFRETCKIQTRQYKALKTQILASTPKEDQKAIIKKLKDDQRRKLALLGEQYEQSIAEMLQKQSVSIYGDATVYRPKYFLFF